MATIPYINGYEHDFQKSIKSQTKGSIRGHYYFRGYKQFFLFLMLNFYALGAIQQEKHCDKLVKSLKDDEHFGNLFNQVTISLLSRYNTACSNSTIEALEKVVKYVQS